MKKDVILGIGGLEHGAASALMIDGKICAAALEESFNHIKHYAGFPSRAIDFCLRQAGISLDEVTDIAIGHVLSEAYAKRYGFLAEQEPGMNTFADNILSAEALQNLFMMQEIESFFSRTREFKKIDWLPHHMSHVASVFYAHDIDEAAFLSVDYLGEWDTTAGGRILANSCDTYFAATYPHSLGILYAALTEYLGFRALADEYKVMGLSSYGLPIYRDQLRRLVTLGDSPGIALNTEFFNLREGFSNTRYIPEKFMQLLGVSPREQGTVVEKRHADIAASLQAVILECVVHLLTHLKKITGSDTLCYTGELALNCSINTALAETGLFKRIFIHPASGDSGTALGACYYLDRIVKANKRKRTSPATVYLGPEYPNMAIQDELALEGFHFEALNEDSLLWRCVKDLVSGKVVGWFQGRTEWGPRALGNRSILADPRDSAVVRRINSEIKHRELFRPFAPAVLAEEAPNYFEYPQGIDMSYMLFLAKAKEIAISQAPAVVHVDKTSRIQTVSAEQNYLFWKLIYYFFRVTGVPMLLSTSFNAKDTPIVNTPQEALSCFVSTGLDVLYMGNYRIPKTAAQEKPELILAKKKEDELPIGIIQK